MAPSGVWVRAVLQREWAVAAVLPAEAAVAADSEAAVAADSGAVVVDPAAADAAGR
jgi:hypothetical protein